MSFFEKAGNFLTKTSDTLEKGITSFYKVESAIREGQTARTIDRARNTAIRASAKAAPTTAAVTLPSVSDFLLDSKQASNAAAPALMAGAASKDGLNANNIMLGTGLIFGSILLMRAI